MGKYLEGHIEEDVFRFSTKEMDESARFAHMFESSIGLVKPNREFVLCEKVA